MNMRSATVILVTLFHIAVAVSLFGISSNFGRSNYLDYFVSGFMIFFALGAGYVLHKYWCIRSKVAAIIRIGAIFLPLFSGLLAAVLAEVLFLNNY